MALPSLFKSTPFLVGAGALGAGGIGIAVWQTTGSVDSQEVQKRAEISPDEPNDLSPTEQPLSPSSEKEHAELIPDKPSALPSTEPSLPPPPDVTNLGKMLLEDAFLSNVTSPEYNGNPPPFRLSGHGCFKHFFPDIFVSIHDFYNKRLDAYKEEKDLLVGVPQPIPAGNIQGCTTMVLSHMNDRFLLKSETVVKNDGIALVLWTGIKKIRNLSFNTEYMQLRVSQYLAFLTQDTPSKK